MALFCAALRRESVSLLRFPFISYVQDFSCEISLVCHLECPYSSFSSHFCFLVIFVLFMFVLSVLFLFTVISHPLHFLMESSSHLIDVSTLSFILASPLPPSFLGIYSLSTSFLPYASSWVFLFSCPFVGVLLWSTLRMVPSILQGGQLRYLSLWWDFCYVVGFQVVSSFCWGILFFFLLFFLSSPMFNSIRFQYFHVLVSFLFTSVS